MINDLKLRKKFLTMSLTFRYRNNITRRKSYGQFANSYLPGFML